MDEETSNFIKKYKQILQFKSRATKKINSKMKRYNITADNNSTDKDSNTNNNNDNNKKPLNILPYIYNNRQSQSSQINIEANTNRYSLIKTPSNNINKNTKKELKMNELLEKMRTNRKEYRQFIIEQSDMRPKINIRAIDDDLYSRLLKRDNSINSMDDSKVNTSKENKDENINKVRIKLPFLSNIKSRYLDYNEENKKRLLENINNSINDSHTLHENIKKYIKKSNSAYKKINITKKKQKYYYTIVYGNNGLLVEKILSTRPNWEKINDKKPVNNSNLIWSELSQEINFISHQEVAHSQLINHFEYHNNVSNKKDLFINLLKYCEYNRIDLFTFFPLTIIFNSNESLFNEQIEGFKELYNDISDLIEDKIKDKDNPKKYIHYIRFESIKKTGSTQNVILPKSFYTGKNIWLLKRTNFNRGREIKIYSDINAILTDIDTYKKQNLYTNYIIQKYLEDPFLYDQRKFDIRIWVLFTYISNSNKFKTYVFKEGHLKACSEPYDINSKDLFIHLTNYSVQKYTKNFSKVEKGNEISFETFQKKLDEKGNGKNFKKDVMPKIIKIIAISANAAKNKINILNKKNCFEIFGYDFILDSNLNPFLLEINTNPGLEESSPLIEMLVPRMIDDAFRLTIDKIFERDDENKKISLFKVDGYTDEENMWEFVDLLV